MRGRLGGRGSKVKVVALACQWSQLMAEYSTIKAKADLAAASQQSSALEDLLVTLRDLGNRNETSLSDVSHIEKIFFEQV